MFPKGEQPDVDALIELGIAMEVERVANADIAGDSNIPAGYTYLGQFIDHDITMDETKLTTSGAIDPETSDNLRTPGLDLDSVYGSGPGREVPDLGQIFENDGVRLRIGLTSPTVDGEPGAPISGNFPNDLPRNAADKRAIIGDKRNDENLAVAQTHLAFLKFHNAMADKMANERPDLSGEALFEAVKTEVVLHYQSIVLTDFLPRLVQEAVLQDVLSRGRQFYTDDDRGCMPVEFSVAAYRMGHSMVRPAYEWNRVFNSTNPNPIPATLSLLFEFTQFSGTRGGAGDETLFGKPTLPSNWIIDWTRFYDFSDVDGIDSHPHMNVTRDLDTKLAFDLKTLPEFQHMGAAPELISLATRNLLRGRLMSLPSGQQVANEMQNRGIDFTPLTSDEIASGLHEEILREHGFHTHTPLWYYILKEAKVKESGHKLGPVGSRIVAEVLVGLIEHSRISLLKMRPDLKYSMPELLAFVGDLNPLG